MSFGCRPYGGGIFYQISKTQTTNINEGKDESRCVDEFSHSVPVKPGRSARKMTVSQRSLDRRDVSSLCWSDRPLYVPRRAPPQLAMFLVQAVREESRTCVALVNGSRGTLLLVAGKYSEFSMLCWIWP
jgi:hypothetical protein